MNVYDKEGKVIRDVMITDDCERRKSLQGENCVVIKFSSDERVLFPTGAYIDYEGERFTLLNDYKPRFDDGTYVYELHFAGIEEKLAIISFFRHVKVGDNQFVREPEFYIDADLKTIGGIIVDSLRRDMGGDWVLSLPNSEKTENKHLAFSAMKFAEALNYIATEFGTEWWVEGGNILHLDKCEYGDYVNLSRRPGGGLRGFTYQNEMVIPERIYVYGSERNITRKTNSQNIPYHTRLQLPGEKTYIQVPGVSNGIEEIKFFEDVYPRQSGTIASVRVDERGPYYFFKNKDPMNIEREKGASLRVHFESGSLNGRDFDVNYDPVSEEFEIINSQENEMQLPFGTLIPQANDTYVLYGLVISGEPMVAAQNELMAKANEYVKQLVQTVPAMQCVSDPVYFAREGVDLNVGNRVCIYDEDFPEAEEEGALPDTGAGADNPVFSGGCVRSRVMSVSYRLTSKSNLSFTVAESVGDGVIAQIQDKINDQASAIDGVYQQVSAVSRNGWQSAEELSGMIDALRADLVLVGNTDGQFAITCAFQANYENNKNSVHVSSGQLQHAIYTDNEAGGRWGIDPCTMALPKDVPYYIYAKCSKSGEEAEIEFMEDKQEHTGGYYYFLVGTVSSIIDRKRALYIVNGYTLIAGGNITTGKLQDASGSMVIDLDTGTIKGPVTFTSGTSGLEKIKEWKSAAQDIRTAREVADAAQAAANNVQANINGMQIGGRNYLLKPSGSNGWEISEEWKLEGYKMSFYGSAYRPIRSNIIPVKKGDVFTFSGDILSTDSIQSFAIQITYFDTSTQTYINIYYVELRETGRHTFTFEIDSDVYDKIRLNIFSRDSSGDYSISLDNLKLEKGNRATDWSPAPEDMKPAGPNLLCNTGDFRNTDYWQLIQDEANINARLSIEQGCLVVDNFSNPQNWIYLWNTSFSDWKAGGEYVFSCELDVENINNWVNIEVTDGLASKTKTLFIKSYFVESSPVRITDTFVVPENYAKDETSLPHFRIRIDDAKNEPSSDNPLCKIKLKNVIVSEGNTCTGYSKNPTEIDNRIADLDYLKDTFEKDSTTEIAGGVTLSRFIGVKAADNTTVTGGMCGNAQNGLPLLFAGGDTATANLVERASNAMFSVKNDGSGQWGIFQVLNNKVIIYDEQGDRASVVISNRKVSEESNKENSFKSVTLFNKQSAVWNTDNLLTEPGVYPSVEKKTETLNLTYPLEMEAGFWRVSINTSLNAYISKMVTSTATIPYGTVLGTVRLYVQVLLYIEDASTGEKEVITISRKDVDMGDDFSLTNSMSDNFYIKYANNFNFDTAKKVYLMVFCEGLCSTLNSSSYPVQSKYTWRVIFDKIGGNSIISAVKTVNQNIIGSDGISIVYDGDEFFEVTKKDNGRIKILATLHTPADVNSLEKGQLYCDANGFVKVKQ